MGGRAGILGSLPSFFDLEDGWCAAVGKGQTEVQDDGEDAP
jgi:hypothetical protein